MISIFLKEVNAFLNSVIAYLVIIVFLTAIGLYMWVFPGGNVLDGGYASMEVLFFMAPYVFLFLIPAITMRTFAEERKAGTMELLLTRPVTDTDLVLAKFLSSFVLVVFSLLPTLIYYFTVYQLGNPVGNIDTAGVIGSYIGLLFLGAVFTSVGVFSSSITDNQIVAFILAVFFCFFLYSGFTYLAAIDIWSSSSTIIDQLGVEYHYSSISKGLIDTRDVIYFLSVIVLMLFSTKLVLASRNW